MPDAIIYYKLKCKLNRNNLCASKMINTHTLGTSFICLDEIILYGYLFETFCRDDSNSYQKHMDL